MTPRRSIAAAGAIALFALGLAGCEPEVGSARWCERLEDKPKTEWNLGEAANYAKHCLLDVTEVGSASWCERLAEKPKGDWSANEAADYARHCLLKGKEGSK